MNVSNNPEPLWQHIVFRWLGVFVEWSVQRGMYRRALVLSHDTLGFQ